MTRFATLTTMKDEKTNAPKETVFCFNNENEFWLVKEAGKPEFTVKSLAEKQAWTVLRQRSDAQLVVLISSCTIFARRPFNELGHRQWRLCHPTRYFATP